MSEIDKIIDEKMEDLCALQKEISQLLEIKETYPDVRVCVNRWNRKRYCSKLINNDVDMVEFGHNCGCCEDSPLEIWPYKEVAGLKIYSDPCGIIIGEKNSFYGVDDTYLYNDSDEPDGIYDYPEIADYSCIEKLKSHNISQTVIDIVKNYLKQNAGFEDNE